jgi:uncharacterized membrane protein SpoIIM required for sporulation
VEFRREREAAWRELEALVVRVEKGGFTALGADELMRLPLLYRTALSSLSVARAISLDRNVVAYLESLCVRALPCVYGPKRSFREAVGGFVTSRFPQTVRAMRGPIAVAAICLVLGAVTGYVLTAAEPELFSAFVDPMYASGREPGASREVLRSALYGGGDEAASGLSAFSAFLFTHNAQIGILAFALGFLLGLPVFVLMFLNGGTMGAFAALYGSEGLGTELWAWLLPHGVTELTAVVLCGAAGLALARGVLFPGERTRLDALAAEGRQAGVLVVGAVAMFLIAGLIEGIFRQRVQDVGVRYGVAAVFAALWTLYFTRAGRRA